jgi:hypothetical protein
MSMSQHDNGYVEGRLRRLISKLSKIATNKYDCWEWGNSRGRFLIGKQQFSVSRLVYEYFYGPIGDKLVVDHLCYNQLCVNPYHLEATTYTENLIRAHSSEHEKYLMLMLRIETADLFKLERTA